MDCLKNNHEKVTFKPKKPPYELTREYLMSKEATRHHTKLYDCGDHIRTANVKTRKYFGEQELTRIERLLQSKRKFASKKRKELDGQWEDLQKKETELREMFIKFNQFIIENNDKRIRADRRISELKTLWENREKEIERISSQCTKLETVKRRMSERIVSYRVYEEFLRDVVQMYPQDFESPFDVLNRYELVRHTSRELCEHHALDMDNLEEAKLAMTKTVDRYIIQLSGLHTKMALLQQRHEAARGACRKWEELYERVGARAAEQLVDVASVRESAWRIYREMCERKGTEPVLKGDYEGQFDVIKTTLGDYRRINELVGRVAAEGAYASERPCVSKGDE